MLYSVVFMEKWCAKAQHCGQIPFVSIVLKLHRRSQKLASQCLMQSKMHIYIYKHTHTYIYILPLWIHSCGEMFRLIMGINVMVMWGL